MGHGNYSLQDWTTTKATRSSLSSATLFSAQAREARQDYTPKGVKSSATGKRESRDNPDSPVSVPIQVYMDVTGSMQDIPEYMAKKGIGDLMAGILEKRPVQYPQVLLGTFADGLGDSYPLQVAQFEADNRVAEQAVNFHLGGGGASDSESYDFPWLFSARMVETDAWDKRQKKGYLFTMGDEPAPNRNYTAQTIEHHLGIKSERGFTTQEMLAAAKERWMVFHIVIENNTARGRSAETQRSWPELLGPNALFLDNYEYLAELIVAIISVNEGVSIDEAIANSGAGRASVQRAFDRLAEQSVGSVQDAAE